MLYRPPWRKHFQPRIYAIILIAHTHTHALTHTNTLQTTENTASVSRSHKMNEVNDIFGKSISNWYSRNQSFSVSVYFIVRLLGMLSICWLTRGSRLSNGDEQQIEWIGSFCCKLCITSEPKRTFECVQFHVFPKFLFFMRRCCVYNVFVAKAMKQCGYERQLCDQIRWSRLLAKCSTDAWKDFFTLSWGWKCWRDLYRCGFDDGYKSHHRLRSPAWPWVWHGSIIRIRIGLITSIKRDLTIECEIRPRPFFKIGQHQ